MLIGPCFKNLYEHILPPFTTYRHQLKEYAASLSAHSRMREEQRGQMAFPLLLSKAIDLKSFGAVLTVPTLLCSIFTLSRYDKLLPNALFVSLPIIRTIYFFGNSTMTIIIEVFSTSLLRLLSCPSLTCYTL